MAHSSRDWPGQAPAWTRPFCMLPCPLPSLPDLRPLRHTCRPSSSFSVHGLKLGPFKDLLCTQLGLVPSICASNMWHVFGCIKNCDAPAPPLRCSRVAITDACISIPLLFSGPLNGPGVFTRAQQPFPLCMTPSRCVAANLEAGFVIYAENCSKAVVGMSLRAQ